MISQGILSVEIINNFAFDITSLELELINTDNQVVIGQFSIQFYYCWYKSSSIS